MTARAPPSLTVNGAPVDLDRVPPDERLLDTLRWRLGLKGTKEGCRTGECGACTVLVDDTPALSCLTLTHEVEDGRVLSIEGAERDPVARRAQAAFEEAGALQCGYCTPGFVLALAGALHATRSVGGGPLDPEALAGNLCRCTGYAAIRRAVALASEARSP